MNAPGSLDLTMRTSTLRCLPPGAPVLVRAIAWGIALGGVLLGGWTPAHAESQIELQGTNPRTARRPVEAPGPAAKADAASAPKRPQFIDISKAEKPPARESLTPPPAVAAKPQSERSSIAADLQRALDQQEKAAAKRQVPSATRNRTPERPVMPIPSRVTTARPASRISPDDEVAADEEFLKARARALGLPSGAPQPGIKRVASTPAAKPAALAEAQGHAKAAGVHTEAHWGYEGATGPEVWGKLKPEFNLCAIGRRQSPIHIRDEGTITGPAEPLAPAYSPSGGSVVNNGHTIQVDVAGDNTLTVRGSTYKLLQFHFHHPAEERINHKGFSMVVHLVHRNDQGQLAVVAVLIDPGEANPFIDQVWTYMPLDVNDRVPIPANALQMAQVFPKDMRYFQFLGSLTTPPCTEGVLWMVLKAPVTASREQIRFFSRIFPNNARPVQPQHDRVVREAQ